MNSDAVLALSLILAVFLWGGNNTGTKYIVGHWPPVWTGSSRFFCAGLILLGILRCTTLFGQRSRLTPEIKRRLWWRGGLGLAAYIVVLNFSLRQIPVSHVALYLGASPVWALIWEGPPTRSWNLVQRYGAAALALSGVIALFGPALKLAGASWTGEALGLLASLLWTNYGHQCRIIATSLSGAETSAHTMWRAGVLALPLGVAEVARTGLTWRTDVVLIQAYCILAGGVVAFAIWNNALRRWPTGRVLLFNNLIPLSTMSWARVCLGEDIPPTFWVAMVLIVAGVILGQTDWEKVVAARAVPPE